MRITHNMISDSTIRNLRNNLNKLESLHTSITTGKRLSRPSDDPAAVARMLTYTSDLAAGEGPLQLLNVASPVEYYFTEARAATRSRLAGLDGSPHPG